MTDDGETLSLNTLGIDQLIKALKSSLSRARVGVLGAKTNRDGLANRGGRSVNAEKPIAASGPINPSTNAAIGMIHEFGNSNMPQRSFLRVPIAENLQKKLDSSSAFDQDVLREVLREGSIEPWLEKTAVIGENIVLEAFDTGGYGKWPPWRTPGYENNTGQILVDSTQLRNSISSEVK